MHSPDHLISIAHTIGAQLVYVPCSWQCSVDDRLLAAAQALSESSSKIRCEGHRPDLLVTHCMLGRMCCCMR